MRPPRILLDLDCVLADFVTAALAAHGLTWDDVRLYWPVGRYGMTEPIGRALAERGRLAGETFTDREFWAPINANPDFWGSLAPLPWAAEVVRLVASVTDDWLIVTSPSDCPTCVHSKRAWVRRHVGAEAARRMEPVRNKALMAKSGVVLIDDCDANVEAFEAEGGHAVPFPTHHNRFHELAADPVAFVRAAVEGYTRHRRQ